MIVLQVRMNVVRQGLLAAALWPLDRRTPSTMMRGITLKLNAVLHLPCDLHLGSAPLECKTSTIRIPRPIPTNNHTSLGQNLHLVEATLLVDTTTLLLGLLHGANEVPLSESQ